MALIDELRTRWNVRHAEFTRLEATVDEICNELQDLEVAIAALADPDIAAAALTSQETFDFEAPAQADPPSELRDAPPAASEESGDQFETTESEPDPVLRAFEDDHIVAPSPPIDEQTCEPVDARVSWNDEPGPRPEDASILNDPDLIAGVERAQATLDAEEGYAPVVATQTYMDGDQLVVREITAEEFYAPPPENVTPTNPAADEAAAAHDYYSPEAVEKRGRFNPFSMFHKRETEDA